MNPREIAMDRLAEWTDGSPVVRAEAAPHETQPALALRRGRAWAVAFVRPTHAHGTNLMLHGDDASGRVVGPDAVVLLEELVASPAFGPWLALARAKGARGISLPRTAQGVGWLQAEEHGRWEFMSTSQPPPPPPDVGLQELESGCRDELVAFLATHNARTDGRPFARPGQRWVGVRGSDGGLLGIGCCEPEESGAPVLTGITVAAGARGLGLGRAITAELTRGAVAEHGWSTLGMYSDNDVARGLYHSLGYTTHALWSSGRLA
ncbi:GNAT family N-acetyltransferase [Janibacter corallicola]|uniref:GNAT family N-acetyltransferase n=1 Tax=Janibacter corallicola TaxID=415212 RepID=UPI0008329AE8|nr:GNAT family N-acetyltransferase [Janibacter corallicola]